MSNVNQSPMYVQNACLNLSVPIIFFENLYIVHIKIAKKLPDTLQFISLQVEEPANSQHGSVPNIPEVDQPAAILF